MKNQFYVKDVLSEIIRFSKKQKTVSQFTNWYGTSESYI